MLTLVLSLFSVSYFFLSSISVIPSSQILFIVFNITYFSIPVFHQKDSSPSSPFYSLSLLNTSTAINTALLLSMSKNRGPFCSPMSCRELNWERGPPHSFWCEGIPFLRWHSPNVSLSVFVGVMTGKHANQDSCWRISSSWQYWGHI